MLGDDIGVCSFVFLLTVKYNNMEFGGLKMYIGWTPHHPSIRQMFILNIREIEYEISEEVVSSGITQETSSPMGVEPLTF